MLILMLSWHLVLNLHQLALFLEHPTLSWCLALTWQSSEIFQNIGYFDTKGVLLAQNLKDIHHLKWFSHDITLKFFRHL